MTTAPFGSWSSPITADLIVSKSVSIGEVFVGGDDVWWSEARPEEGGRVQLVRHRPGDRVPSTMMMKFKSCLLVTSERSRHNRYVPLPVVAVAVAVCIFHPTLERKQR